VQAVSGPSACLDQAYGSLSGIRIVSLARAVLALFPLLEPAPFAADVLLLLLC
jgi:hypothetical protein